MEDLRKKVIELLESKTVALFIGYEAVEGEGVRACFITAPDDTRPLVHDARCVQNLALYFKKKEIRKLGRIGVFAPLHVVRALLQMASENQIREKDILVLGESADGTLLEFKGFADMEAFVASAPAGLPEEDLKTLQKLAAMAPSERLAFWTDHFSRCVKCYACRAACPMCFCGRCQVEFNQPQIIIPEATPLGSLEWHFMRAMHLAGRCVNCGECGRSCPVGIPVHLLSYRTCLAVQDSFDVRAGVRADLKSVLSDFRPDDKEDFFK